jgi:hypothetical protein
MPFVVMLIEFGPLDEGTARLNDPAHIAACGQQFARHVDRRIAGSRRTGSWQLTRFREHNMPHHLGWLPACSSSVRINDPCAQELFR